MKKFLKILLIIVIVIAILFLLGGLALRKLWNNILTASMAPENYTVETATGGDTEAKYLADGSHETGHFEADYPGDADIKKIQIWYPADLESSDANIPWFCL